MESSGEKWVLCELTQWSKSLLEHLVKVEVSGVVSVLDGGMLEGSGILIVPYYTSAEIIIFSYVLSKSKGKNYKLVLPKSVLNSPISLFVVQRGVNVIEADEEPKKFAESLLSKDSRVVLFPESGFINEEEFLDSYLGFSPFYLLAKELYDEIRLLRDFLEAEVGDLLDGVSWYISGINYIPSRFRGNPFKSLCDISYEELASGYLNRMDVVNTFADVDNIVEVVVQSFDEFEAEGLRRKILGLLKHYSLNFDRICLRLLSFLAPGRYSERQIRNKLLFFWKEVKRKVEQRHLGYIKRVFDRLFSGESTPEWDNLCLFLLSKGILRCEGDGYYRVVGDKESRGLFSRLWEAFRIFRISPLMELAVNDDVGLDKRRYFFIRVVPDLFISYKLAREYYLEDLQAFEEDYTENFHSEWTKDAEVGKPFFFFVPGSRIGVVLLHGYLSAPMEVRALGEYLYEAGISVYGVRLKGHGTSPLDLAKSKWEEWYESLNRGVSALRCLYERIYICGFSAGGCLALYSASRKNMRELAGVISISAPIKLQNYAINLLPTVITLNYVFKRFGGEGWDLLDHKPENPHINYQKNPLAGLRQLRSLMEETEKVLSLIKVPVLVIQGSQDNTVNPESANIIFAQLGAEKKYKLFFNRSNHGIINGPNALEIYSAIKDFILNDRL